MLQSQQYIILAITLYNVMSVQEAGLRKDKYIFNRVCNINVLVDHI